MYNLIFPYLPLIFLFLMGLSIFIYVILDGYDLGVGILLPFVEEKEKDLMISSIGPFWDANETWLVLGIGILLIAFPIAHGNILTALYFPATCMLIGLILRGTAFELRMKAPIRYKGLWNKFFFIGSLLATFSQGYMLGSYIMGFDSSLKTIVFNCITGICLIAGYSLLGSSWLIMKTEENLQKKAVIFSRITLWGTGVGLGLVSIITPLKSSRIFEKWFNFPSFLYLFPLPLGAFILFFLLRKTLKTLPQAGDKKCWVPFVGTVGLFLTGFLGLAYSFYPYIIPEKLTFWEASGAPESLYLIFIGVLLVVPFIIGYTLFSYRVFWGKTSLVDY